VDPETFRGVMSSVCTPVSVVTAMAVDRPHGTTVSAFASLSVNPPMVLISLDRTSELLGHVRRAQVLGLNVLHAGQAALATAFARKGTDKFTGVGWSLEQGVPRLHGAMGWLACRVERLVDGGDHVVVFGLVVAAAGRPGAPLTYHRRRFGTHQAHRERQERPLMLTADVMKQHQTPAAVPPQPLFATGSLEQWFAFN
jgi:flavin reductase (DIM6/NTAB) family NADH-FMN oxidoreductase RutF